MSNNKSKFAPGVLLDNRYRVQKAIGQGGMGQVYLVEDLKLSGEILALKIIDPQVVNKTDPHAVDRFKSEVLISRKLTHQNIIRTYDYGVLADGQLYMTMEYVDGTTLEEYIKKNKERKNNFPFAIFILRKISDALSYAKNLGVTHRDLKAQNILLSKAGDVKIADFGLAQMKGFEQNLTVAGECVGTPYYMSPEQVQGNAVNHRSDIYALGIIAYQLIVGEVPFDGSTWYILAKKIINDNVPFIDTEVYSIPLWFNNFIQKATAKAPEDRFSSGSEIIKIFDENFFNKEEIPAEVRQKRNTISAVRVRPEEMTYQSMGITFFLVLLLVSMLGMGGYFGFDYYKKTLQKDLSDLHRPIKLAPYRPDSRSKQDINPENNKKESSNLREEIFRKVLSSH